MSNPRRKSVSGRHTAEQTKTTTVIMTSTSLVANLVETAGPGHEAHLVCFRDPHTALSWCIDHRAGFVFVQGAIPALN